MAVKQKETYPKTVTLNGKEIKVKNKLQEEAIKNFLLTKTISESKEG